MLALIALTFALAMTLGVGGGLTYTHAQSVGPGGVPDGRSEGVALDPRQFGADFNGHFVGDASTTNGSNVVTCPNSDCDFSPNISGYIIFATLGSGTGCQNNPSIEFGSARQTTVTGFTNANSITVAGNANTTATGTACLAWFPIDSTAALTNWWTAGGCTGSYVLPAGATLFSSPIMQNIPGCVSADNAGAGYPGQTVRGAGIGSTFLVPAPNFNYSTINNDQAVNCAVGNKDIEHEENFTVYGLGERATSALNVCLFDVGAATSAFRIDLVGWDGDGSGGTSLTGVSMDGNTDTFNVGGINYFGTVALNMYGVGLQVQNNYITGISTATAGVCTTHLVTNSTLASLNNAYNSSCVQVDAGATLDSTDDLIGSDIDTCLYVNGGNVFLHAANVTRCGVGIKYSASGSTVTAQNSSIAAIEATASVTGTFLDFGGNTLTGTITLTGLTWPLNTSQPFALTTGSVTGCGTVTSPTGSGTSGTFHAGATSCAPVITTGIVAKNGYVCSAQDLTTPADTLKAASSTTTTCTFGTATVGSGDTIQFQAVPF